MVNKISVDPKTLQAIRIADQFYPKGKDLRETFDTRFKDPLSTRSDRFVWDYWLVPDQYKLLRTPAESFFPKAQFQPFLEHLLHFGRTQLGCQMISHPWLSVYIDGCYQSLHSDVPHGPWSFVYSLTHWGKHRFQGGETLVAKPKLLNYFSEYSHEKSDEKKSLFTEIEPKFNRLTLFDPRYPHGVNRVTGEDDLRKSRIVIHGWFTEPRPTIEGSLTMKKVMPTMDHIAISLIQEVENFGAFGLLAVKFQIAPSGSIQQVSVLSGHLIDMQGNKLPPKVLFHVLNTVVNEAPRFPKSSGTTYITLPVEFRK